MIYRSVAVLFLLLPRAHAQAADGDAYYAFPLNALQVGDLGFPEALAPADLRAWHRWWALRPYAALDGAGEAYVAADRGNTPPGMPGAEPTLVIRAAAGADVAGTLFVPDQDIKKLVARRFKLRPRQAQPAAATEFLQGKRWHYERLKNQGVPGGAWFRHRVRQADAALGKPGPINLDDLAARALRPTDLQNTFALFTGGRAISENLQLDRALPPRDPKSADRTVRLDTLRGIEAKEMDWKAKLEGVAPPDRDPLAKLIPADQHALLLPTFDAMLRLADEADRYGTLALDAIEPRSEDARTRQKYERQLCLSLSEMGRLIGKQMIRSVAVTGSDPYLRVGSDVAVLFEAGDAAALEKLLRARLHLAGAADAAVKVMDTGASPDGPAHLSAVAPDRSVCSYVARLGESAVIVTNSRVQLGRLAASHAGKSPSIGSLDEYTFFRARYPRGKDDEAALLLLTDAAIRRWCGPRWRIADSRRTRAAALFAELQAEHIDALAAGEIAAGAPQRIDLFVPELGELTLRPAGVHSSDYGSLAFMTPIVELSMDEVTVAEAESYRRWRDTYESNWRQYFDPIAVRFSLPPNGSLAADMTVMPLIRFSTYRPLVSVTSGAEIAPAAADPHAEALAHLVMAVNTRSPTVTLAAAFAANNFPGDKNDLLKSVGQSVALYADDDPFWKELAAAPDPAAFFHDHFRRAPVALHVELKDAERMDKFLAAAREWVEQGQPGRTTWETLRHNEKAYVKVTPTEKAVAENRAVKGAALFYANAGDALVVTMHEGVLRRALDRRTKPAAGPAAAPAPGEAAWLGKSGALRVAPQAWEFLRAGLRRPYQDLMRKRSWDNLPILNEWKRLYPTQDPVKLHERFWQTRLHDPAGGDYVWDEKHRTMQSTTYGHPGEPKDGPATPSVLEALLGVNFGITFEDDGIALRARGQVQRRPSVPQRPGR